MKYIMKIVKSLEDSGLLLKQVRETMKQKKKKEDLSMLLFSNYVNKEKNYKIKIWF